MTTLRALALAGVATALAAVAVAQPLGGLGSRELLDPLEAFRLSLVAQDAGSAHLEFRIADGYYLYRDRFRFETEGGRVIADAELPGGKVKHDPFFGRTEIYRERVRMRVPLGGADLARGSVRLKVVSQGCSDSGVCYIPQEQWVEVGLGGRSRSPLK